MKKISFLIISLFAVFVISGCEKSSTKVLTCSGVNPGTNMNAAGNIQYTFENDKVSIVYMTDTGMIHSRYHEKMKNKTVYLLESNHDVEMEMNGNKFEYIKYRNIGDEGHLSNEDCAKYLNHFIGPNTKYIMLVHISENDNTYEKAYEANRKAIDSNIPIYVAYKDKLSETIEV